MHTRTNTHAYACTQAATHRCLHICVPQHALVHLDCAAQRFHGAAALCGAGGLMLVAPGGLRCGAAPTPALSHRTARVDQPQEEGGAPPAHGTAGARGSRRSSTDVKAQSAGAYNTAGLPGLISHRRKELRPLPMALWAYVVAVAVAAAAAAAVQQSSRCRNWDPMTLLGCLVFACLGMGGAASNKGLRWGSSTLSRHGTTVGKLHPWQARYNSGEAPPLAGTVQQWGSSTLGRHGTTVGKLHP